MCEPCLCGDPECKLCFPWDFFEEEDTSGEKRQDELDDALKDIANPISKEPWI